MAYIQRWIQLISIGLIVAIIQGSPLAEKSTVNTQSAGATLNAGGDNTHVNDRTIQLVSQAATVVKDSVKSKGRCAICVLAVTVVVDKLRKGATEEGIREYLISQCKLFRIQEPAVCDGIIALFAPEVVHIANRTTLSSKEICSFAFTEECGNEYDVNHDWSVPIPGGKPAVELIEPSAEGSRLKVLHFSDTHLDPHYAPGSLASCALPLCCRLTSAPQESGKKQRLAGRWGDYGNCDAPERLVRSALEHASKEHPDIDYILWTGDILPHDIWNQTREDSISAIRGTVRLFKEYFPNTPIFPAIGNHESVPVNSFPTSRMDEKFSVAWLYDELAEQWPKLTSSISGMIIDQVRHSAFYSVLVRPNFRIISLHTAHCITSNWWAILDNEDPANELRWLTSELKSAEEKGEKVHIIGHIPPGLLECRMAWSRNFDLIVNRFESTIKGLFYGHTHKDEFQLSFDRTNPSSLRPSAVAYIAPSVTPFEGGNPAYRIYWVDGEHQETTWTVLDHDTWWMDLDAANQGYTPIWRRLYNARKEYNLQSLSPTAWAKLVRDMATNDDLFERFYRNTQRNNPRQEECDNSCKRKMLCDLLSFRSGDTTVCQNFLPVEELKPVVSTAVNETQPTALTPSPPPVTAYHENDGSNEVVLLEKPSPSRGIVITPTVVLVILATILLNLQ